MVKIAVLAPMPRARVRMATAVKPGDLRSMRRREAEILENALDKADPDIVAAFFFDALDTAELDARATHSFHARHAIAHQILGERFDMETEFRVHLALHARTIESRLCP